MRLFHARHQVFDPQFGRCTDAFTVRSKRPDRRTYRRVVFEPAVSYADEIGAGLQGGETLNLWQGFGFHPEHGSIAIFEDHVLEVWCRGDAAEADGVLDRMAAIVQHPDRVGLPMDCFVGAQGSGKSGPLERFFKRLLGPHCMTIDKHEHALGKFNAHLRHNVALICNEALWGGDKRLEGPYKMLFTDPTRVIEVKFGPVLEVPNRTHGFLCSNNTWVAPLGSRDRRHVFHEVSNARADMDDKANQLYFKELFGFITGEGGPRVLGALLDRKIDFDALRRLPAEQAGLLRAQRAQGPAAA